MKTKDQNKEKDKAEELNLAKSSEEEVNISTYSQVQKADLGEKLTKAVWDVKKQIDVLDQKFNGILDKHHNDYLVTFNEFMDIVKNDLKIKIEELERVEKERRKNENIKIIIAEREFFRSEAIRLNRIYKEIKFKLEESNKEIIGKDNEINILKKKIYDSEFINKQITQELKRNATYMTELEAQNRENENRLDPLEINDQEADSYYIQGKDLKNNQNGKFNNLVESLKNQLKKEKLRNTKLMGDINKMLLDKNNLERIFIECVEETRKDIIQRRNKENPFSKTTGFNKKNSMPLLNHEDNNIKFENFLNSDKKKVLETYLMRDDVINFLHENLFTKVVEMPQIERNDMIATKSSFLKSGDSKLRSTFFSNRKTQNDFSFKIPGGTTNKNKTPINLLF